MDELCLFLNICMCGLNHLQAQESPISDSELKRLSLEDLRERVQRYALQNARQTQLMVDLSAKLELERSKTQHFSMLLKLMCARILIHWWRSRKAVTKAVFAIEQAEVDLQQITVSKNGFDRGTSSKSQAEVEAWLNSTRSSLNINSRTRPKWKQLSISPLEDAQVHRDCLFRRLRDAAQAHPSISLSHSHAALLTMLCDCVNALSHQIVTECTLRQEAEAEANSVFARLQERSLEAESLQQRLQNTESELASVKLTVSNLLQRVSAIGSKRGWTPQQIEEITEDLGIIKPPLNRRRSSIAIDRRYSISSTPIPMESKTEQSFPTIEFDRSQTPDRPPSRQNLSPPSSSPAPPTSSLQSRNWNSTKWLLRTGYLETIQSRVDSPSSLATLPIDPVTLTRPCTPSSSRRMSRPQSAAASRPQSAGGSRTARKPWT